jgi:hypothetical protein
MFREEKNLKDTSGLGITIKDNNSFPISYSKTNKLITALYMVTDILDKDEPLRNKLRTLGIGIISDINSTSSRACAKISEIMSLLDISSAINIISEMNCNILRKEFSELDQSIKDSDNWKDNINRKIDLTEMFSNSSASPSMSNSIGHHSARIGVQKGSTLLKALHEVRLPTRPLGERINKNNFDILKKQRREEIIDILQKSGGNATITDIRNKAYGSLTSCGEKTLQRELISMVKDNVLNKTGEKRWSKYFIK